MNASRTASTACSGSTASSTACAEKTGIICGRLQALDVLDQPVDRLLRVAEQHHRLRVVEERVLDAGEARVHAALEHDHRLRLVDIQDRHSVDRTALVVAG